MITAPPIRSHACAGPERPNPPVRPALRPTLRPSRGYTLLEMLVVISLLGGMIGGTMTLLSAVRVQQQRSVASATIRRDIARLADDLRRDVADSDSVTVAGTTLTLESAGGLASIEYRVESNAESLTDRILLRTESHASPQSQSQSGTQSLSPERYHLGGGRPVAVRWDPAPGHLTWALGEYQIVAVRNP